ncbi:TIGR03619 family F420-dependent LLM class oxidoreductase [Streptomyces violaceusniger]|uniref:Luciferase-like, subgroup n=1 Tax=Streptomyces violaceusniger (strain Tu 4113) TaxID=653045 RepID=G2PF76_STRV4|nr:TIGR03619 family F420-dependent LLM class oxidoreductase [Streptomyces violaceusniger]AEM84219.1 Luciferase-like, subgroup [Streptomyces violaceusniger Tu 4113]
MKFGIHLGLPYTTPAEVKDLAQQIEDLNFDWISIFDHMYSSNGTSDRHCLEAVTMQTFLATVTKRVRIGCLVYVAGYRPPGTLAKSIATMDQISGGRITLGLGAGWNRREFSSFGLPFLPPVERSNQLEEYVAVVRSLLSSNDPVTFTGSHFSTDAAVCEPQPVQSRLPIWIGGTGERRTLPMAARLADGWNAPFLSPEMCAKKRSVLAEACEFAGRDISEVMCSVNIGLAWSEESLVGQFGRRADEIRKATLFGNQDEMSDLIERYREAGVDQLNISLRAKALHRAEGRVHDFEGLTRLADFLPLESLTPDPPIGNAG